VLQFPIVINAGVVVGDTAFVGGVVNAVGDVDEQGGLVADDLIAVADAGGDEDLPGAEGANVEGVAAAEGGGVRAKVDEGDLEHTGGGGPVVGLEAMDVEGFDGSGQGEGGGDLGGFGREASDAALADARNFEKVAAVVGPEDTGDHFHAGDELVGVGLEDNAADAALFVGGEAVFDGNAHAWWPRVAATRLLARRRDPKVPASVHQPSRGAKVMVPSAM